MWDRPPGFASLLHIMLEQQVSLASARATFDRLKALADPLTAENLLRLDDLALRTAGFSRQNPGTPRCGAGHGGRFARLGDAVRAGRRRGGRPVAGGAGDRAVDGRDLPPFRAAPAGRLAGRRSGGGCRDRRVVGVAGAAVAGRDVSAGGGLAAVVGGGGRQVALAAVSGDTHQAGSPPPGCLTRRRGPQRSEDVVKVASMRPGGGSARALPPAGLRRHRSGAPTPIAASFLPTPSASGRRCGPNRLPARRFVPHRNRVWGDAVLGAGLTHTRRCGARCETTAGRRARNLSAGRPARLAHRRPLCGHDSDSRRGHESPPGLGSCAVRRRPASRERAIGVRGGAGRLGSG